MFEIIAVTNRSYCVDQTDFLRQVAAITASGVSKIILREKDLSPEAYESLAQAVLPLCLEAGTDCVLHRFVETARACGHRKIHLPLPVFEQTGDLRRDFDTIGVSVHSLEQARQAIRLGATYLIAGHIFATDCKKGLSPRGIGFLRQVCESVRVPVYAIGGISEVNIGAVRCAGAAGACLMSGLMKSADPEKTVRLLREKAESDQSE